MEKMTMVGDDVIEGLNKINTLHEGAGETAALKQKGNFEPSPHRLRREVGMKRRFAKWLIRVGYRMLRARSSGAGLVVTENGKWQAIKL